jgi:hypothetical protein
MIAGEEAAGGSQRFVRQRYEDAFGAVRVALGLLREIYPCYREAVGPRARESIRLALRCLEETYVNLDDASIVILGSVAHKVLTGEIDSHAQLDQLDVPR